ncbi:MAG: hypothetical protein WCD70_07470 [Alphaproteobacteria bacterium]
MSFVTPRYLFNTAVILALSVCILPSNVRAEESQFDYVYTTDMLPEGQKEIIQWATDSSGQAKGNFDLLQGRTGFEYGVSDRFQAAVYANYAYATATGNGPTGATDVPSAIAGATAGSDGTLNAAHYVGTTLEGLYRILSPFTDGVGVSVLAEPTIGNNIDEFDTRLILQKDFMDDQVVFAGNIEYIGEKIEPTGAAGFEPHAAVVLSGAGSYRFIEDWSGGLELVNQRDFGRLGLSHDLDSVFFLGPSVHYGNEAYFVTLGILDQLPIADNYADHAELQDNRLLTGNFSKYQARMKFGYYF